MFVTCKSQHVTVCLILGSTAVTEVKYSERTNARVVLEVDVTGTANKNNTSTQNRISETHHDKKDRGQP